MPKSSSNSIARSSFATLTIRVVMIACGMGTTAVLARFLGTEDYGTYLYLLNIVMLVSVPVLLGMPVLMTRQIATYRAQNRFTSITGIIFFGIGYTVAIAVLSIGIIGIGAQILPIIPGPGFGPLLAILLLLFPLNLILIAMLYGFQLPVHAAMIESFTKPVALLTGVAVLAYFSALSVTSALLAFTISMVLAIAVAVWFLAREFTLTRTPTRRIAARLEIKPWLAMLLPLGAISLMAAINSRVDVILLGNLASLTEVAIYGVALQIIGLTKIVRNTTLAIVGPRISALWAKKDLPEIEKQIILVNRLNLAGALIIAVLLFFFAETILTILTGDAAYSASASLAIVASFNVVLVSLLGPAPVVLMMCGFEKYFLKSSIAMAALNVLLNILLIPSYGAFGALVASLLSEWLFQLICLRFCRQQLKINTMRLF